MNGRVRRDIVAGGHRLECMTMVPDSPGRGPFLSPRRSRPTLVFLHEGLGSVGAWRDFPEALARATGYRALVYSRLGYGDSEPLDAPRQVSFMHDEAQITLPALLAAASIEDAILVGHSDGASIAIIYAAHPSPAVHVRGLILEAPHVFVEEVCTDAITRANDAYETSTLREKLGRHHTDPDGAFHGWADAWLRPEFRAWNIEGLLPRVRAPMLVIQGEDDGYGTLAQVDSITTGAGGRTERVILRQCGHAPHKEAPEQTLAAMTRFIASLDP